MKSLYLSVLFLFLLSSIALAQDLSAYQKKVFSSDSGKLAYRIIIPNNFDASKKYPLLLFLHGAGERGNDNEKQLAHGASLFIKKEIRVKYPSIVVMPQCPTTDYWSNVNVQTDDSGEREFMFDEAGEPTKAMTMLIELVNKLLLQYPVKKDQVYVGGLSMGGMGTFEIVRRMPNTFAAAFAICGGANTKTASQLIDTEWWIFHGEKDSVVPVTHSETMNDALKNANAKVKLTIYPEDGHDSWTSAFAEPDLMTWLFTRKLNN